MKLKLNNAREKPVGSFSDIAASCIQRHELTISASACCAGLILLAFPRAFGISRCDTSAILQSTGCFLVGTSSGIATTWLCRAISAVTVRSRIARALAHCRHLELEARELLDKRVIAASSEAETNVIAAFAAAGRISQAGNGCACAL